MPSGSRLGKHKELAPAKGIKAENLIPFRQLNWRKCRFLKVGVSNFKARRT